ncbi:MAG: efflux RND transporter permease subunit [Thermodesulfobacteriota bacterium]|nr:efflux RND transporter permease subunit [Thermodesulfobacteriota bacterium]
MFLPDLCIKRPVAATMMVVGLVIFGIIGFMRLGISLYPDVDLPMVTVTTYWENARPEEIDNEITDELEDAVSGVSGIKHIASQSLQGLSRIIIEFELDKDVDVAAQEVRDRISARLYSLPDEADVPVVDKLDIRSIPIIWLAVTGQQAIEELNKIADEQVRPLLQKIQGVGQVLIGGGKEKEVKIWLHRERLAAYNLGVDEVISAIRNQHLEIPGGKIETKEKEFLLRTIGEFETPEAFNDLIVAYRDGTPIRLSLLGYAEAGREESKAIARFGIGDDVKIGVGLGVAPRSGANEVAIATRVREALPEIRKMLPEGMDVQISTDYAVFIEQSIGEIKLQLVVGGLMAAMVIFLFLQNIRTTLISAIAIPTSIISTFACMYALDFTMNNMTMLGLVMAVGLVIDDAIVMVENIFRHRSTLNRGPMQAAFKGSDEIGFAIISTTTVLAGVFLPVAFMGGVVGEFFFEFAVTVAFAVACSTFVALTVVPMLSSRFLTVGSGNGNSSKYFNRLMDKGTVLYRKGISWSLRHRFVVALLAVGALCFGGWLFSLLGKEFVTAEDKGKILIRVETPLSYSIEKTDKIMLRIEDKISNIPEVSHFFSVVAWGGGGAVEPNKGMMWVTLTPKNKRVRTQNELQVVVRGLFEDIPDIRGSASEMSFFGGASRTEDIQFVIEGQNIEDIDRYSRGIMERMADLPGFVGVTRDLEIGKPEVRVRIDREKAADAGINVRDIAYAVGSLMGGIDVTDYKEGGKTYDVRLRLVREQRRLPGDIQHIWIRSNNGKLMDIKNFVDIEIGVGPNVINRLDRQRSATIYANLQGKLLADAMTEVQAIADEVLPEGYSSKFTGRAETFYETAGYIAFAFVLAIVFTYMILGAQFESFTQPFAIMMGLPLSFIGAFGLLFLLKNTFNIFSMIGLVFLVGLAAKNGILLIDYTNQLRAQGKGLNDALIEAGATRLRPILMTAISTIAGVIPVVLGIGVGSETRQPMAVAITGGILSSTLLTLAVVPVIYSFLDQLSHARPFEKIKKKIMAHE